MSRHSSKDRGAQDWVDKRDKHYYVDLWDSTSCMCYAICCSLLGVPALYFRLPRLKMSFTYVTQWTKNLEMIGCSSRHCCDAPMNRGLTSRVSSLG